MKPRLKKIPVKLESSYNIKHDVMPNFGNVWHYHPELELHYNIRGEGLRFIGDNIDNFSSGEIILLGQNLPHAWRCREEYFQQDPDLNIEAIVIQFLPDYMGKEWINIPEAYMIPKLYETAKSGMLFYGETKQQVAKLMHEAATAEGLERVILLLSILKTLSESDEYKLITSQYHAFNSPNEADTIRLNRVYTHTFSNYKSEIKLQEIAAISNLSVTSFCRYFKMMTRKSYYDFLIEIRVSHACRMLIENLLPTEVICFECGFNNVSNFYRHFKKQKGVTPLEYKRIHLRDKRK